MHFAFFLYISVGLTQPMYSFLLEKLWRLTWCDVYVHCRMLFWYNSILHYLSLRAFSCAYGNCTLLPSLPLSLSFVYDVIGLFLFMGCTCGTVPLHSGSYLGLCFFCASASSFVWCFCSEHFSSLCISHHYWHRENVSACTANSEEATHSRLYPSDAADLKLSADDCPDWLNREMASNICVKWHIFISWRCLSWQIYISDTVKHEELLELLYLYSLSHDLHYLQAVHFCPENL